MALLLAEQKWNILLDSVKRLSAPGAREVFGGFEIEEETMWTISTVSTGGGQRLRELIVSRPG